MGKNGITQRGIGQPGNHRDLYACHDFSRLDSENTEAKDAITPGVNEGFHKAPDFGQRSCPQYRGERDFRQTIRNTTLVRLSFAETDPGKLRIRKYAEWYLPSSGHAITTQNIVVHDVKVILGDVSKVRAAG